jgi:hypothetical protein
MSAKSTLLAVLATVAVATGVVVLPATGHDVKPTGTLGLTGKGSGRDQKMVDVRPKGISLGDQFLGAETLRQAGTPAGRMEVECVVIDHTYAGQACSLTLILKDGQVTAQGAGVDKRIPGIGDGRRVRDHGRHRRVPGCGRNATPQVGAHHGHGDAAIQPVDHASYTVQKSPVRHRRGARLHERSGLVGFQSFLDPLCNSLPSMR